VGADSCTEFQQDDLQPTYKTLTSLPIPLSSAASSSSSSSPTPEFPSVLPLSLASTSTSTPLRKKLYLASAGTGTLYLLDQSQNRDGDELPVAVQERDISLPGSSEPYPFLLRAVHLSSEDDQTWEVILTRTIRTPSEVATGSGSASKLKLNKETISYEIVCLSLTLPPEEGVDQAVWDQKWILQGEEFPTAFFYEGGRWVIGGGKKFELPSASIQMEGGAVQTEATTVNEMTPAKDQDDDVKEYPYSWTQTKTTISVSFHLPSTLQPNRDVICLLRPSELILSITPRSKEVLSPMLEKFLQQAGKEKKFDWWDRINREESTWTWTKPDAQPAYGVLTLELEKANEGVKWPSLFAPPQDDDKEEIEVPETLSDEDLGFIRSSLAGLHQPPSPPKNKFAGLGHPSLHPSTAVSGNDTVQSLTPNGAALPGLLMEEMEDEDDWDHGDDHMDGGEFSSLGSSGSSRAGKETVFTYLEPSRSEEEGWKTVTFSKTNPVSVLSRPFTESAAATPSSLMIKSHVDGHLYRPPQSTTAVSWKHISTNPALSFVLASKRDSQFVYHHQSSESSSATVFAFESRQSNGLGGNCYVYWPVDDEAYEGGRSRATESKQAVIKFGEGVDMGQLMGITMITLRNGAKAIVGLAEKALAVFTL
jgi:hypothetical protein